MMSVKKSESDSGAKAWMMDEDAAGLREICSTRISATFNFFIVLML